MKTSERYSRTMTGCFISACVVIGAGFWMIHPVLALLWVGAVLFLLSWAARECHKDALKEEAKTKPDTKGEK